MKANLNRIYGIGSAVIAIIGSVVFFPEFSNKDLHQAKINYNTLGACVVLVAYGTTVLVASWAPKKRHSIIFTSIGVLFLVGFVCFLFTSYFPLVNRKVMDMRFSCGGSFIRGDSVNLNTLQDGKTAEYDSLSKYDPKKLVEMANCDPSMAWTFQSVEDNFKRIVYRYMFAILLGSMGLIALAKSPDSSKSRTGAKQKPKTPASLSL